MLSVATQTYVRSGQAAASPRLRRSAAAQARRYLLIRCTCNEVPGDFEVPGNEAVQSNIYTNGAILTVEFVQLLALGSIPNTNPDTQI